MTSFFSITKINKTWRGQTVVFPTVGQLYYTTNQWYTICSQSAICSP